MKRIEDSAINRQQSRDLRIDPQQWFAASTTQIELMRTVESRLLDAVVGVSRKRRAAARVSPVARATGVFSAVTTTSRR